MKHKIRRRVFDEMIRHPMRMLAYFSLRAALRNVPAVRFNRNAVIVAVMPPGASVASYEKAAALLVRGADEPFNVDPFRSSVRVLDGAPGRKSKDSTPGEEPGISDRQTIYLAHSLEAIDPVLRLAADAVVHLKKPTADHIVAARKLAHRRPISKQMAEKIAALNMEVIGAVIGKGSLKDSDLREFEDMRKRPADKGPRLGELPGFAAARAWTEALVKDVGHWRSRTIPWGAVNRGTIISGPPGTGKTLFASALARTLGFQLIATSVGAWQSSEGGHLGSMLRAMRASFAEARAANGAVLFIDEIEAIGDRERIAGDYIYYETSIVTQLLELTDGSSDLEGVVIIAATNYPERVDPALRRSGRFGNHFRFGLPSDEERAQILALHLDHLVDVEQIRSITDHLDDITQADLESIALQAKSNARHAERALSIQDISAALPARIDLTEEALLRASAHEIGHALIALNSGYVSSVTASVRESVRQGLSLSYGLVEYEWDAPLIPTEKFLLAKIRVALAGMAAEEVLVGDRSVGAGGTKGSDLNEATMLASRMIESYGFGKNLRFMRPARWIDESYTPPPEIWPEIDQILQKEYRSARDMLAKNREQVAKLAAELYLDKRILIERDKIQPAKSARH